MIHTNELTLNAVTERMTDKVSNEEVLYIRADNAKENART